MKQVPYVPVVIWLIASLAVVIFVDPWTAKGADVTLDDKHAVTTGQGVKPQKNSTDASKSEAAPLEEKAGDKKTTSKKKGKVKKSTSRTPYGYGQGTPDEQWNYRKTMKIERDLGQNMRSIDNAIRKMNTDINRIRTLDRRF